MWKSCCCCAVLSFFAQGNAKNDRCAIIKNIHGKLNQHVSGLLYFPSTKEVQTSCLSVKTGAFLSLGEISHFSPTFTPLFELPDPNLIPKLLSFEYGTWRPLCWGFLCSFIFAFISPSFWRQNEQNLLSSQHKPWQAAQSCQHGLHDSGGHTAPQNFIFEGIITKATTFRAQLATPEHKSWNHGLSLQTG